MLADKRVVLALKAGLVALFAVLVVLQVLSLPGQFRYMAEQEPDLAHLRWPLTALAVFWVLCVQVVVIATWRLLGRVQADRIFDEASFAWVDAILGAIGAAWVVLAGVFLVVDFTADDPGVPLLLFLLVVGVAVLGLLMLVMRALLRQATMLRSDMDEVI
ncbi:DUF2975 domain-containing protein [Aeromicrobium sp. CF4.19]|uniref:DUF2975 domain-containing protein n=1 Tax=Aeromicrobium sp. CF4.19 TaxID=3373082 RepID=UPI003EE599E4